MRCLRFAHIRTNRLQRERRSSSSVEKIHFSLERETGVRSHTNRQVSVEKTPNGSAEFIIYVSLDLDIRRSVVSKSILICRMYIVFQFQLFLLLLRRAMQWTRLALYSCFVNKFNSLSKWCNNNNKRKTKNGRINRERVHKYLSRSSAPVHSSDECGVCVYMLMRCGNYASVHCRTHTHTWFNALFRKTEYTRAR